MNVVNSGESCFHLSCSRVRGTNAQIASSKHIIAINLRTTYCQYCLYNPLLSICTYKGCRLPMLVPDAIAPVINGEAAAPAEPKLEIQPIPPEISSWGRTRPAWFITMG